MEEFSLNFNIRTSDVNDMARLKMLNLLYMLNNTSCMHADQMGLGLKLLKEKKLAWFLVKYNIEIDKPVFLKDEIEIRTWTSHVRGPQSRREFLVTRKNGSSQEVVVRASNLWMLFDLSNRKLLNVDSIVPIKGLKKEFCTDEDFSQLFDIKNVSGEIVQRARYDDIDLNGHANHCNYLVWAIEALGYDFCKKYYPTKLEITYLGEVFYNDNILSSYELVENEDSIITNHLLQNEQTKEKKSRMRISWKKIDS